jgi:hypothetical protein
MIVFSLAVLKVKVFSSLTGLLQKYNKNVCGAFAHYFPCVRVSVNFDSFFSLIHLMQSQ